MSKLVLRASIISLATLISVSDIYAYEGVDLDESEFFPIAKKYVNNELLNVRNRPVDGVVVDHLKRGDAVLIYDINQDWSRISEEQEAPKWVFSKYLCSYDGCSKPNDTLSKVRKTNIPQKVSTSKVPQTNRFSQSYSGACSCSSESYCYGPRGGRYCYTSGGNKSYR